MTSGPSGRPNSAAASAVMLLVLTAAAGYWLWFGTTQRAIVADEGISILAAQGVLEHGHPRLPSGLIYHRSYLPVYLLAASIGGLGLNDLAIMLPSLLLAAASLFVTYRFGRDVLGQPVVGLLAAVSLVLLTQQTFYATSARMYMSLQFFTTLAIYAGWRGFIEEYRLYKLVTLIAVAGAILSHQQGGTLLVALPVCILAIRLVRGNAAALHLGHAGLGLLFLVALFWASAVYVPVGVLRPVILNSGVSSGLTGLNLDLANWAEHWLTLESAIPFGFLLGPLIAVGVIKAMRTPGSPTHGALLYCVAHFAVFSLALCAYVLEPGHRMWLAIVPMCLLASLSAIAHSGAWLRGFPALRLGLWGSTLAAAGWVILLSEDPLDHLSEGYGLPCSTGACSRQAAQGYTLLQQWVSEDDLIVSTNPWVTHYYLGRVNAVFRQRRVGRVYTSFDSTTDEYFGIDIIDSLDRLRALRASPQRVWIVADHKLAKYSGPAMKNALWKHFFLRRRSQQPWIFSNTR